jgi:hypothetical protein
MPSNVLYGGWSPANCARKIPGPLMVFISFTSKAGAHRQQSAHLFDSLMRFILARQS